jgi:hypothetical protein
MFQGAVSGVERAPDQTFFADRRGLETGVVALLHQRGPSLVEEGGFITVCRPTSSSHGEFIVGRAGSATYRDETVDAVPHRGAASAALLNRRERCVRWRAEA